MEYEEFELGIKKINEIRSYLIKNEKKNKNLAWMGVCEKSSSVPGNTYYLYENLGLIIHNQNINIYGKNKRIINKKISKLIKLSEGY